MYVPPDVVTNTDLKEKYGIDTTHEWVVQRTGIEERRFAKEGVGSAEMGSYAAKDALNDAKLTAKDLDMIIFASLSPDMCFPGSGPIMSKWLGLYEGDDPKFGAMAMTESGAGSDNAAIQTTAKLDPDTNEWVLNGEKIFCTNGKLALIESNGLVVVWATVDRSAGRAGMKPFVVEPGMPGVKISKVEIKHGIRASDTAAIVFDNARIPYENLLGDATVRERDAGTEGFKRAMATFDASRPLVAASAIGVGRAALEFVKETLKKEGIEIPYGKSKYQLTAIQRDVIEMEEQLKAAWLLTMRATAMLDLGERNSLEASMAKAKAGKVVTQLTQRAVEILGPMGYSREWLVEKWMRDGRINSLYEGTDQINLLIIARRILGYTRRDLQ